MCGNALCSQALPEIKSTGNFQIDTLEKKVYAAVEGPGYCGVDCAAASKSFAHRLGSGAQAMHRFEKLMEQLREKKRKQKLDAISSAEATEVDTQKATIPPPPAVEEVTTTTQQQPTTKPKGVLKKSDLAAGSVKVPIMTAAVKERDPTAEGAEPPKAPSARKTHAIEGYVPKAVLKQHRQERREGRRVRFSDATDDTSDNKAAGGAIVSGGCEINPAGDDWDEDEEEEKEDQELSSEISTTGTVVEKQPQEQEEQVLQPEVPESNGQQPAVFVLDVEDAPGPIEGAEHALNSKFGRLRVANADEVQVVAGVPSVDGNTSNSTIQEEGTTNGNDTVAATTSTAATAAGTEEPSVDEILAQRLRQGASKYFPQLAATLPPELAQTLDDSASEAASSDAGTEEEEWMLSDTDTDEEAEVAEISSNGGRFRSRPTFFGELVTNLDAWVTGSTVALLQRGPDDASTGQAHNNFSLSSQSVPEIETALSRFIAFALPPVMEKLAIGMPKGEVERNLMELIKTLQLVSALPAFTSSQWQLVVAMFLKALSIERVPGLQPAFETREGVHRMNQMLTANLFTIEEFVAVLEILLEAV
jgi:hypothetical protein